MRVFPLPRLPQGNHAGAPLKRGETSGRADDNLETIAKRFDTFMEVSMPVMDHFADKVHKVSSVPAPDEVFVEVCKVFEARGIAPVEAAAEEEEEVEEEEELVPVAELEKDADMVAAATKIQAVHRGRAARKEKKVEEAPAAEEVLEKADPAPAPEHLEAAPVVEEAAAEAAGEAVPPPPLLWRRRCLHPRRLQLRSPFRWLQRPRKRFLPSHLPLPRSQRTPSWSRAPSRSSRLASGSATTCLPTGSRSSSGTR